MRFRTKALAKRRQAEDLDRLPEIAKPRGWLAAAALSLLVLGVVAALFAGSIPYRVSGPGVLASEAGVAEVQSSIAGEVTEMLVDVGDVVQSSTPVAELRTADGSVVQIPAGQSGEVLVVRTGPGRVVAPGDAIVTLARSPGSEPTLAYLFLGEAAAAGVAPGMEVDVSVGAAPNARYGAVRGVVTSVGQRPVSPEELDVLLANGALVEEFAGDGPAMLVTVGLSPAGTPTGLEWTGGDGPDFALQPGALVDGDIRQGERSLLDVVLGKQ
jgi:hypothetical protein